MRRFLVTSILLMAVCSAWAQSASAPKTEWLEPFTRVKIDAPANVTFKQVQTDAESRIVFDTKGENVSEFTASVNAKGVLVISEKKVAKRRTTTDVVIYYHALQGLEVAQAEVTVDGDIVSTMFDVKTSKKALVAFSASMLDIEAECKGSSRLSITGTAKYFNLKVSGSKVECSKLKTTSSELRCSGSSYVTLYVSERLETKLLAGSKLFYQGAPAIVRNRQRVLGGKIENK